MYCGPLSVAGTLYLESDCAAVITVFDVSIVDVNFIVCLSKSIKNNLPAASTAFLVIQTGLSPTVARGLW